MIRLKGIPASAFPLSLLLLFFACQPSPVRRGAVLDANIRILTDPMSVRTRGGERLDGYLAEYVFEYERHRIFVALEIPKYVKDERLTVKARSTQDTVLTAFGDQPEAEYPVFEVLKAEPYVPEKPPEMEKIGRTADPHGESPRTRTGRDPAFSVLLSFPT
jgi:hypothetical protein